MHGPDTRRIALLPGQRRSRYIFNTLALLNRLK
jgi:hypothetical protein